MDLMNTKVRHSQFGDGIVTGKTASMITIQFSDMYGEKRFLYPSCFEDFLTTESPDLQKELDTELRMMHQQTQADRRKREEENVQRKDEQSRALLEKKRAAAKKSAAAKKTALSKLKAQPESTEHAAQTKNGV